MQTLNEKYNNQVFRLKIFYKYSKKKMVELTEFRIGSLKPRGFSAHVCCPCKKERNIFSS